MARPNKTGLDYFPLDVDFFDNYAASIISVEYGIVGEVFIIRLLCEIYKNGYFIKWDDRVKTKIVRHLPDYATIELLDSIVQKLVNKGLFDANKFYSIGILTSREIQLNWIKITQFVGEDFITSPFNLVKDVRIPTYKLSDKVRMHQHDVKRWYRIMKEVFRRDNYTCQYCGAKGGKLEVDHIIPFSRGGSDDLSNLTTSCRRCNRQKRDKTREEFLIWKELHK